MYCLSGGRFFFFTNTMSVVTLYNAIREVQSQGHDENWTDTFVSFGRQMVTTSLILTASNIGNIANSRMHAIIISRN